MAAQLCSCHPTAIPDITPSSPRSRHCRQHFSSLLLHSASRTTLYSVTTIIMMSYNASKPEGYPPSKTALLLLDYQNVLINMIQDPEKKQKLVDSAKTLLETAREHKVAIIHCTMDIGLDPPPTNKVSEAWHTLHKPAFSGMPEIGAEYAELAPAGTSAGGHESISLRAPGYRSALVANGILETLQKDLGVKHLVLGGIATSGAVLGTATHATDLDFVVTVVEDACWDPNEQVHRTLIDTVIPTLAWVSSVDEAVACLTVSASS